MKPFKEFIEDIASAKAPGPSMTFDASHIFFAFELMAEKTIGRNNLAKELEVGEGTIRTIISRLKSGGLISTSKKGCTLTEKGCEIWKRFEQLFPRRGEIGKTELTEAKHNYAFLVKNSGQNVRSGIEQRDAAVVAGASGAVVIVSRHGHLAIESVSTRVEKRFPEAAEQIRKALQPQDNDVVALVGAASPLKAKHGAFAASWTLVGDNERA
jgi:predicted transcriptional regulator